MDGRLFFRTVDNQKIMIVKQLKHLEKPGQKITTVPFWQVQKWYIQLQKCFENVAEEYKIIYLFITNKQITHIPQHMPDNLMLVDASIISTYYGPFVAQFVELMAYCDDGEEFESEPDEEDLFEVSDEEH